MKPAEISFVVARCTFVPAGSIIVYRWPGKDRFNVLGATLPTEEQALAAINEFLKAEQEQKAEQDMAKRLGMTIEEYRTWLGKQEVAS